MSIKYTHNNHPIWNIIGESLVQLGTLITTYNILADNHYWTVASLFLVWAGATIPKFTKAKDVKE